MLESVAIVGSYLLGSLCAAVFVVRWRTGQDVRDTGSGNAGARNAGRLLGRRGFAAVFVLDAAKGALAVIAARLLGLESAWQAGAMLAVTVGHILPCWHGFRGGKGAACAAGALLAFSPLASLAALLTYALTQLGGSSARRGLLGVAVAPLVAWIVAPTTAWWVSGLALLVAAAHLWRRR